MLLNTYTDSLDFNALTQWIDQALSSVMPAWGVVLTECILIGLCLLLGYALIALALIYVERKVCAFFQCRLGPNRVGPYGTVQSIADMVKMLIKELITIDRVDRFLVQSRSLYRDYLVGAGVRMSTLCQRTRGARFQCGNLLLDGRFVDRRCRNLAGRLVE